MPDPDERLVPDEVNPQDLETAAADADQPHSTSSEVTQFQTLRPSGKPAGGDDLASRLFGDYEIIQEIARGGMGVVYRARQISLNRTVALKKILSGQFAGQEDLKRFQIEAEASAQLDHPGIVPVYDFGQVDGQYYFSMAYVEGDDLAKRIRERPVEPETAAAMMVKIAQAVGYANAQGVIHRDLKPNNVLLDQQGEPKVTDFGVAKQQGTDSELTAQGQILGTPSYMPPEQAAGQGDQVDQRSDVYALGAILYALLTGRPPFQSGTAIETMNQVLNQEPVPISKLNASIARDLETICLKCLQKDPSRRYVSADALAEELRRYLSDEPILARPPARMEQLGRWVRKNKTTAISAAVVAAALIIATVVSISFAIETGRQRDAAELATKQADDQRTIAEAKTEEARQSAEQANERADELQQVSDFQAKQLSRVDPQGMGQAIRTMVLDRAQVAGQRAGKDTAGLDTDRTTLETLLAGSDFTGLALGVLNEQIFAGTLRELENLETQPRVQARLLQVVAVTMKDLGLLERAFKPLQQALEIRRRTLGDDHPDTLVSINSLGMLLMNQGKYDEAEPLIREALEARRRRLGDEHPRTLTSINNLGGLLMEQGKFAEAEPLLCEVLENRRRTLGDEHPRTLTSINNLGSLLMDQGKYDEAEPLYRETVEASRRTLGDEHPETLTSINNLGALLMDQGNYDETEPLYRESLEGQRRTLGDEHPNTLTSIHNLGVLFKFQGKYDDAGTFYREALEGRRRTLGDEHPNTLISINNLALLLMDQGKYDEAEPLFRKAVEGRRRRLGDEHPNTLGSINNLGLLLESQGKYDEAEPLYREALEVRRRRLGDEHPDTLISINNLGLLLKSQGKYDEAEPLYREALEVRRRRLGDEHSESLSRTKWRENGLFMVTP